MIHAKHTLPYHFVPCLRNFFDCPSYIPFSLTSVTFHTNTMSWSSISLWTQIFPRCPLLTILPPSAWWGRRSRGGQTTPAWSYYRGDKWTVRLTKVHGWRFSFKHFLHIRCYIMKVSLICNSRPYTIFLSILKHSGNCGTQGESSDYSLRWIAFFFFLHLSSGERR